MLGVTGRWELELPLKHFHDQPRHETPDQPMISREEALTSAADASAVLFKRLSKNPGFGIYRHAQQQLTRMLDELNRPNMCSAQQREWVDIGLMATKELETTDSELADALMDADHDFKHTF